MRDAYVFSVRSGEWQVWWRGHVLPTTFNSRGSAIAYLSGLYAGRKAA